MTYHLNGTWRWDFIQSLNLVRQLNHFVAEEKGVTLDARLKILTDTTDRKRFQSAEIKAISAAIRSSISLIRISFASIAGSRAQDTARAVQGLREVGFPQISIIHLIGPRAPWNIVNNAVTDILSARVSFYDPSRGIKRIFSPSLYLSLSLLSLYMPIDLFIHYRRT